MALDFDYAAARAAGYSDDDILNGLQKKGRLSFDLKAAREAGHSGEEIMDTLVARQKPAAAAPAEEGSSLLRRAGDIGISAIKGAMAVPEAAVGLADIVTGGAAGRGAEALGLDFKAAREVYNDMYSPEQKAANQRVADADGFLGTAGAMFSNPSTIVQTGVESLPAMIAGGGIGRGVVALAPKLGAVAGGAIGEGAIGAGQQAEQIRQQSGGDLSLAQSGAALASGFGTGAFGLVGGRLAQKLNIGDIDTMLVRTGAPVASGKGVARRILEGSISEGVFEELPQSIQEQIWQNAAMDKPLLEGVPENAAQGLIAGGLFGGVAGGALHGKPATPGEQPPAAPLLLGNTPDPFLSFPDGSVGRRSDAEAFINGLPENERPAARARLMGMEPQPVTPADVLAAPTVDDAIAAANAAIEQGTPEMQAQRNADIDAAWNQHLAERAAVRQSEFDAAQEARRAADVPRMQDQLADQQVEQAAALTSAQGFDDPAPTTMQLAMQEAQQKRAAMVAAAQQRATTRETTNGQPTTTASAGAGTPGLDAGTATAEPGPGAAADRTAPAVAPAPAGAAVPDAAIGGDATGAGAVAADAGRADAGNAAAPADAGRPAAQPAAAAGAARAASDADVARARSILSAAGVTGNERMAALRAVRTGENTLDDLIDAHPPKEIANAAVPNADVPPVGTGVRNVSGARNENPVEVQRGAESTVQGAEGADPGGAPVAGNDARPAGEGVVDAATPVRAAELTGNPLQDSPASWIIRNKETGDVIMETFDRKKVDALNTEKYEAVPAYQHLTEINDPESKAGRLARGQSTGEAPLASIAPTNADGLEAVRAEWQAAGIKNFMSERDGKINLSQIVVPKEQRGNGAGTRAMQQLVDYADRTGQTVTLTPSADFGGTKSRLVEFYKRLGFVENKGRNKDYEISEAMYRPADGTRASTSDAGNPASAAKRGMSVADVTRAITRLRAKWLGFTKINVVQSAEDLPVDLRERAGADSSTEGLYDPRTKSVYLIADNIADPARAAWVAAHEVVGHGGLRMLQDKSLNEALNMAGANRFIRDLAAAVNKDRGGALAQNVATEEAIAEMAAAIETDAMQALAERYGVTIPATAQNGIRGVVARVVEAVRRFLATVTGNPASEVSDADVRAMIGEQQDAVEGRGRADRAPAAEPALASIPTNQRTIEVDGERRPITDSNGELVAPDFAGQVEFWQNYTGPVDGRGRPVLDDDAPRASRAAPPPPPSQRGGEERVPKWAEGLSEAQKAALRKSGAIYTEETMRQKIDKLKAGALKKLQYGIFDQFAPIKEQLGRVPYVLARMAKNADGTLEALMLYGRPHLDAEGGMLVDTTKKGFIETMQALNGEHDRFFSWLAGRRAEQLKKEGRENLFTDDDISSLSTLNQGQMKDGSSREAAYLRAQKDVAELNKSVLDIAEKSGLIDAESRKVWASDFYVPFYRVMEEGITGPSVKSGLVNQKSIKKLKGGTNNLGDLTQNMLMNWSTLLTASAKNRAAKASLDAAVDVGAASEAPEATIRAMAKSATAKAVSYMEDGTNRWFVVEDEHLLGAIAALEFSGYNNQAMKAMSWFKNALTRAITASPYFKIRNLLRDSVTVLAVSDANYNVLSNWKTGSSLLRNKDARAQMVASGGIYRFGTYMEGNRAANVKRLIDAGVDDGTILNTAEKMAAFTRKLWGAYEEVGDFSENLNRAALYDKLRGEGKSHLEASFEARDLMDFGLSGAWAGVRALNQILPFFNARLQGLYKLGRGYNDDPKRMGYVIGAVAMASVALLLAYKDDDDWKKRTDADRNNYWWFKVGGIAYRIPKPFEIGAAGSAIEHMTALLVDSDNTNATRFAGQLRELINGQLAMNPIPQVFRPMIDVYANKDSFGGRPIENMAMQRLKPEDRYTYNTSELARMLSKSGVFVDPVSLVAGTGAKQLSPVQIDSLIRGYFSGVGTLATAAVDGLLHHTVIDRGEALPLTLKDFAGSFAETLPTNGSRYVNSLYETAQDIEQSYASYQNAIKQGDIESARRIRQNDGDKIAQYHLVESLKKNESKINAAIQRTRDSKTLTGEQKEETIRRLKVVQDQIARQFATRQ